MNDECIKLKVWSRNHEPRTAFPGGKKHTGHHRWRTPTIEESSELSSWLSEAGEEKAREATDRDLSELVGIETIPINGDEMSSKRDRDDAGVLKLLSP